jgi:23S rRNA (guanine745-N1)-methyltransferase
MTAGTRSGDSVTLLCSVRGCAQPLAREEKRYVCARNHSFDVARSGYVNLLQPQDRRSRTPGDSAEAVAARRRFVDAGYTAPLTAAIAAAIGRAQTLLDAGCGEGHDLGVFRERFGCEAHGVDISVPAIDAAARRYRSCRFVVANADRFLPYSEGSFDTITSITARINGPEFRRVLRPDGQLVIALPGPDDLVELREAILGDAKSLQRELALDGFTIVNRQRVSHVAHLEPDAIRDVMMSSYRAMRTRERERMEKLGAMDVTLSREIWVAKLTTNDQLPTTN